jgi:hypothetical protein
VRSREGRGNRSHLDKLELAKNSLSTGYSIMEKATVKTGLLTALDGKVGGVDDNDKLSWFTKIFYGLGGWPHGTSLVAATSQYFVSPSHLCFSSPNHAAS